MPILQWYLHTPPQRYKKRTLEQLETLRRDIGPIGVVDFLIEHENSRGTPDRLQRLRQTAKRSTHFLNSKICAATGARTAETNRIQPEKDTIGLLRNKLLGLGFTDAPLAELEKIAHHQSHKPQRARAAQLIAM